MHFVFASLGQNKVPPRAPEGDWELGVLQIQNSEDSFLVDDVNASIAVLDPELTCKVLSGFILCGFHNVGNTSSRMQF